MSELIIESVPSGAEVQLDGVSYGTTPVTIPIDDEDGLTEFRSKYLSEGSVACSWDVLKTPVEDHTVSRLWWLITESERRSVAEKMIKNTLFYEVHRGRSGKANCEGGEGDTKTIVCLQNSLIRYLKFGSDTPPGGDMCYYRQYESSDEFCYVPDIKYNLPCYKVSCVTHRGESGFGHALCAIQVNENINDTNSWIFFQYSECDIKPGDWQMPVYNPEYAGSIYIKIMVVTDLKCNAHNSEELVRWWF